MRNWFRGLEQVWSSLSSARQPRSLLRPKRVKLLVETLEDRVTPTGGLDTTFSDDGWVSTNIGAGGDNDRGNAMVIQRDGKIVVAGMATADNVSDKSLLALIRYDSVGELDTSFSGDGTVTIDLNPNRDLFRDQIYAVTIQKGNSDDGSDDKILVTGSSWVENGWIPVLRFNNNGTLDTSFDNDGLAWIPLGGSNTARAISVLDDGKILIAGERSGRNLLARLNSNGSLDASFGTGGIAIDANSLFSEAFDMALQGDKILISSHSFSGGFTVWRYNSDGSRDLEFGTGGYSFIPLFPSTSYAFAIVVQSDGKIIVGGTINSESGVGIARLNQDGSLDTTYATGGKFILAGSGIMSNLTDLTLQDDGKLIAAGWGLDGTAHGTVARFMTDGTPDPSFDSDGFATLAATNTNTQQFYGVGIQNDGKIVAAGFHRGIPGESINFFAARFIGNDPPVVATNNATVTVEKGQTASNTGTFSDPDGNATVTLTASLDSVTQDNDNGTWTWTAPTGSLELGNRTVTVIATDTYGLTATTDFTLTVNPAATTSAISAQTITYGAAGSVTVTVTSALGVVTGDVSLSVDGGSPVTQALADGSFTFSVPGLTAGTHSLASTYAAQGDFAPSTATGDLTVNKATLKVTADNKSRVFGAANPTLIASIDGFVNGDTAAVVSGAPALSTDATTTSPVGSYTITAAVGTLDAANYLFEFVAGTLTVNKADTTVTVSPPSFATLYGVDDVPLSAAISVVTPGAGSPTGTVTFFDGATSLGTGNVVGGVASINVDRNVLAAGQHSITAVYSGDGSFTGSTSAAVNHLVFAPSTVQGLVYVDADDDGQVDFGETAVVGVTITLTGTDDLGNAVNRFVQTDSQGVYAFTNLRPSNPGGYTITEAQPAGLADGRDTLGTIGATTVGSNTVNDAFAGVVISQDGSYAQNYNFGERQTSGGALGSGQTAGIGFWQNNNGQNLIKALNGGSTATSLGNWLATTFPNMYGASAGANNLAGKTNAQVATFYKTLFARNAQTAFGGGPPKVDAQVMATALAVYVTNQNLAGTTATAYGFQITADGVGVRTFNVGANGAAFGVADNSVASILDLLLAVNQRSHNGRLYDLDHDGDATDSLETTYRTIANDVFSGINEAGGI